MKRMSSYLHFLLVIGCLVTLSQAMTAQEAPNTIRIEKNGEWTQAMIENGDTLYFFEMEEVSLSAPRCFNSLEEERKYYKYKRYATHVYPYAVRAIKIFAETEYVTRNMKKKKRRKHIKRLQKELKKEFQDPLKKLTKTQGYILVEMIERERDESMYELIKDLRSGLTARYWQTMGSMFNYDLKDKYTVGDDPILDMILEDLDVSYELPVIDTDEDDLKLLD